jgi:hypothetical protein
MESPVGVVNVQCGSASSSSPNVASTFRSLCPLRFPVDECTAREEEAEALAEAKGWEHRLAQERMDQELQDLNKKLEEKEVRSPVPRASAKALSACGTVLCRGVCFQQESHTVSTMA